MLNKLYDIYVYLTGEREMIQYKYIYVCLFY